ncbi:MAG TPA: 30S ribosomal protein S24e [Candidatus Nanoarchaeia archaeon]|nr:30S ribosomal protein S24e [Candidatus Nanoarchaeia archaeon]
MELKIISKKENPVLKRTEVQFTVEHTQAKTPGRLDIKRSVASQLQVNDKLVFIKKMSTKTGTSMTVGEANAYQSEAQAKIIEPSYIIKRNSPPEKAKEEAKA